MKKALFAALLLLAPTMASCLASDLGASSLGIDFSATSVLANPLFWHLMDELRSRELARLTAATSSDRDLLAPQSGTRLLATVSLDFALGNALPAGPAPAAQNFCNHVSISFCAVRRIVVREYRAIREESAGLQTKRPGPYSI